MRSCSALRTAFETDPIAATSANAFWYFQLPTAGGAAGRNMSLDGNTNGVTEPHCWLMPLANADGVGRHSPTPGVVGPEYVTFGAELSFARNAMMSAAAAVPTDRPLSFAGPS